jgi:hypothetical protein
VQAVFPLPLPVTVQIAVLDGALIPAILFLKETFSAPKGRYLRTRSGALRCLPPEQYYSLTISPLSGLKS